jgi:hypothetical protein
LSREDALERLSLLGELMDPNPERKSTFSTDEIAEFQHILTDSNYTVRQLMHVVSHLATSISLLFVSRRLLDFAERK